MSSTNIYYCLVLYSLFRESILANVYRSHVLSHFIYSAPFSEKAKNGIKSNHANVLHILKITPDELLNK